MPRNIYLTMIMISGYAPTFPDSCYHLIYYWPAAVDILATVVTSIRKRFHLHSFNPIAKADLLNRIKRGSLIQFISLFVRLLILFLYFFEELSTVHDIICSQ